MTEDEARAAVEGRVGKLAFQTLETFVGCLEAWSGTTNLTSAADTRRLWSRHVLDSVQLIECAQGAGNTWIDLGAGAGFPGMVVAIARDGTNVTLVEANRKKAAFLNAAITATGVSAQILPARAEALPPKSYDVVSARAVAPLARLLALGSRFFGPRTLGVFPKGREAAGELEEARRAFRFDLEERRSRTDPDGVILLLRNLGPA